MSTPSCSVLLEDFALLEGEDRYRYLIELGQDLPPFDPAARIDAKRVSGCVSMVWLECAYRDDGDGLALSLSGDSDSVIVRGLIAILIAAYLHKPPEEILAFDIEDLFRRLGLATHLTPQRSNGFFAMVLRLREEARGALRDPA